MHIATEVTEGAGGGVFCAIGLGCGGLMVGIFLREALSAFVGAVEAFRHREGGGLDGWVCLGVWGCVDGGGIMDCGP